jgi:hypothetical protein
VLTGDGATCEEPSLDEGLLVAWMVSASGCSRCSLLDLSPALMRRISSCSWGGIDPRQETHNVDLDVLCEPGVLGESEYGENAETRPLGDAIIGDFTAIIIIFESYSPSKVNESDLQRRGRMS